MIVFYMFRCIIFALYHNQTFMQEIPEKVIDISAYTDAVLNA